MISLVSAYYNKEDMTRDFLDNLVGKLPKDTEVVLVNAGSKPIEHEIITKRVDLPVNQSFSNSMNAGIKEARGDFVCIIGNDVFPTTEDWLDKLVELAKSTKSFISCPLNDKSDEKNYNHKTDLEDFFITGMFPAVCWLLSRECIDKVGLFDERFLLGCYEDNDYCRRVEKEGGQIAVSKTIIVGHLMSQTLGQFDVQKAMHDNYEKFVQKWK